MFDLNQPWPWSPEFRAAVENLSRIFGPRPKRLLPPDPKAASIAQVVSTKDELDRMLADKPHMWAWAVFASSLLQQRNATVPRLRNCASGYHPQPGAPLSGQAYADLARQTMNAIAEQLGHLKAFMLSPAFTAVTQDASTERPDDPNAIRHVTSRLMAYHGNFLTLAERCLHTPVQPGATLLVQDMWAVALCPLIGYDQFIITLCHRVAEARELLPYSYRGDISVDNADLVITLPRGSRNGSTHRSTGFSCGRLTEAVRRSLSPAVAGSGYANRSISDHRDSWFTGPVHRKLTAAKIRVIESGHRCVSHCDS